MAFTPDYKKPIRKPKKYTFVRFFNVPWETGEYWLTDFVDQFAVVQGSSCYPKKAYYNDIEPKVIHMSPILWTQSAATTNSFAILVKKNILWPTRNHWWQQTNKQQLWKWIRYRQQKSTRKPKQWNQSTTRSTTNKRQ